MPKDFFVLLQKAIIKYQHTIFCLVREGGKVTAWVIIDKDELVNQLQDAFELKVYPSFLRLLGKARVYTEERNTGV